MVMTGVFSCDPNKKKLCHLCLIAGSSGCVPQLLENWHRSSKAEGWFFPHPLLCIYLSHKGQRGKTVTIFICNMCFTYMLVLMKTWRWWRQNRWHLLCSYQFWLKYPTFLRSELHLHHLWHPAEKQTAKKQNCHSLIQVQLSVHV